MVVGKPYVHFTINNEPLEAEVDYTYTWATTVEAPKGPVNEPVLVSSAAQANALFGIDMRPYFAQGAESLIIVRVAAESAINSPSKGIFSFVTVEPIEIYRAEQAQLKRYGFTSYDSENKTTQYAQGIAEETGVISEDGKFTQIKVLSNDVEGFQNNIYFIQSNAKLDAKAYPLFEDDAGQTPANIYVTIDSQNTIPLYVTTDNSTVLVPCKENGVLIPNTYVDDFDINGNKKDGAVEYKSNEVAPFYEESKYTIPAGTPLFTVTSKYEGDYGITVSVRKSEINDTDIDDDINSYDISLSDPSLGTIRMNHVYDVVKIVNRINDRGFNFVAKATNAGIAISEAMKADAVEVTKKSINNYPELITTPIKEGAFILPENVKSYGINLRDDIINEPLMGSSNGEWDASANRIPASFRAEAHAKGLRLLRKLRIAGVFCMYGDNDVRLEYQYHGINPTEPEKGMNNNETCRWRTILLGANAEERDVKSTLAAVASSFNDQYILFLGQGLIDTGVNGIASGKTAAEKRRLGVHSDHQLLPYECTQYVAGLRSKLSYDESIFGGQGRKRIRSVGDLEIAPLLDDGTEEYEWDPKTYTYLNEAGVLTFTDEYGNITLTDGVTTCQKGFEEDEEGVMNILKYAQNSVYNVCLPYIGRNINSDLEQSITMDIQNVLETMKTGHQSLVDTDEYQAYTVSVSLGSRANQLLGRIYVYLTITPAHALRQIEVEMTVQ